MLPQVRQLYPFATLQAIHTKYPALKFGVFTRAPRLYVQTLLNRFYPNLRWDVVVAFEDVAHTKPHPDGIWHAMKTLNLTDLTRTVLVGDADNDIHAAYQAGVWCVLDLTNYGGDKPKPYWKSNELLADNVITHPGQLITALEHPNEGLPLLERLIAQGPFKGRGRITDLYHKDFDSPLKSVKIEVLGRRFRAGNELINRAQWHPLSQQIQDLKEADVFPDEWIVALRHVIAGNPRCALGTNSVVTVIPAKAGRPARLERLLDQLAASHAANNIVKMTALLFNKPDPNKLVFVPNQLQYLPGALSHNKAHLDQKQRMANVREFLQVNEAVPVKGKHVLVIDDVTTSGATLFYAYHKLMAAGAALVTPISMTQAISPPR